MVFIMQFDSATISIFDTLSVIYYHSLSLDNDQ